MDAALHFAVQIFVAHLDWLALALGTIGSVAWAHNGRWSKYASAMWLGGSIAWLAFAWVNNLAALGIRDAIGITTSGWGCYRWLLVPRTHGPARRPGWPWPLRAAARARAILPS